METPSDNGVKGPPVRAEPATVSKGGRPKGRQSAPIADRVLAAALKASHAALTRGVQAVGPDGRVLKGADGKPLFKPATASHLGVAIRLLRETGVLDSVREENEARAERQRRHRNGVVEALEKSRFERRVLEEVERRMRLAGVAPAGVTAPSESPDSESGATLVSEDFDTLTPEQRTTRMAELDAEIAELHRQITENDRKLAAQGYVG
jgi:hypothetical protein